MKHLHDYLFRFVRVKTTHGDVHEGTVILYFPTWNGNDEESIVLCKNDTKRRLFIFASEIVSIEAIEGSPNPAKHLRDYLSEFVRVKTIYGNIHEGKAVKASPAKGKNEDSIGICTNAITGDGVSLFACEIVSIEKINGNPNPVEHLSDFLRDHSLISDVFVQVVRVKTIYGTVYEGEVVRFSPEKDSIGICTNPVTKDWVGLSAYEIVSIEEI